MTRAGIKQLLTMDNILLGAVIFFSIFWALVFNSIDDPMLNQPIHILIDLKRNLLRFDEFLSYLFQFLIIYGSGYLIYWVNHHVLVNRVMARFGFMHYLWTAAIFTLIASPTLSQLLLFLHINAGDFTLLPSGNRDPFDVWNLRITFLIMVFSLPLILAFNWQRQIAEVATLKQEKAQAELKWLQQQINPHFLFNTLNNIYSMTLTNSKHASQSVLQLSNLLRFVVYQGGEEGVKLSEEINYLRDYISLQEMRVSHKSEIRLSVDETINEANDLLITPLLLIVLLENAFKHGIDRSDQKSWLECDISLNDLTLNMLCKNSVDTKAESTTSGNLGIGLTNLQRRLQLSYPGKHVLMTEHCGDHFICNLSIELEHVNHA